MTNIKGAHSAVMAEFVMCGVLYHSKNVQRSMDRKVKHKWEVEPMSLLSDQHMLIVGYGNIGAACAKVAKNSFGMKVTGLKRRPDVISTENRSWCDEIIGNEEYDRVVAEADYVVGILPGIKGVTDDYFNMESTFSKMKESAVFINVGRGSNMNEDDLVAALKTKRIAGAVLDVYKEEPLPEGHDLWDCPNLLMTPHSAPSDKNLFIRAFKILAKNLKIFCTQGPEKLMSICDKK